jgi:hypothetical protein
MTEEDAEKWGATNGHCKIARTNGSREERTRGVLKRYAEWPVRFSA